MKLNLILDSRRIEKFQPLMDELTAQNITEFEIWPCVIMNDVPQSINASHKMIVQDAKEKGLAEVCVGEDDLYFPAADGWQHFLRNKPKPEDYDIYVAATYVVPVSNNIMCGFHLYCVSAKFYDDFLSIPDTAHIDTAANDLKGTWKFCYPFAALQRAGFSANNKSFVNYNALLKPEDIYQ